MAISSALRGMLDNGRYVISAELTPPRGFRLDAMLEHARRIAPHVDIVQLNDQLLAQARCGTIAAALRVKEQGLEPVLQFSLRHRNRIAIQAELLAMAALSLRNVIVLSGYAIAIGSDPAAKDATDLTVLEALQGIRKLATEGQMFNGDALPEAPDFFPGTIEIPSMKASEVEASLDKLEAKIEAGAHYIQVQAIFDLAPMHRWMDAVVARGLHERAHFIAAVFPFSGPERLRFLQKVPGLTVPDHLIAEVMGPNGEQRSLEITLQLIEGIRAMRGLHGLHLRSISAEDWVPRILERAGLSRRVTPVVQSAVS